MGGAAGKKLVGRVRAGQQKRSRQEVLDVLAGMSVESTVACASAARAG